VWYSEPAAIGKVMSAIRRCPEHGAFESEEGRGVENQERCPVYGASGELVLAGEKRTQLSKFLSGALRHFPRDIALALDEHGWTEYESILNAATERYPWADREAGNVVIATDPKGRFECKEGDDDVAGERIRAAYGHSVDVALEEGEDDEADGTNSIPDRLYHGTAPDSCEAIAAEGLAPMDRQEVHLSETPAEAREVGARHASDPIVFAVDTDELIASGHSVTERGRGVYTTDRVPPDYLTEYGGGE
jgi:putative RNA 2'-phosphotransferase